MKKLIIIGIILFNIVTCYTQDIIRVRIVGLEVCKGREKVVYTDNSRQIEYVFNDEDWEDIPIESFMLVAKDDIVKLDNEYSDKYYISRTLDEKTINTEDEKGLMLSYTAYDKENVKCIIIVYLENPSKFYFVIRYEDIRYCYRGFAYDE